MCSMPRLTDEQIDELCQADALLMAVCEEPFDFQKTKCILSGLKKADDAA